MEGAVAERSPPPSGAGGILMRYSLDPSIREPGMSEPSTANRNELYRNGPRACSRINSIGRWYPVTGTTRESRQTTELNL